MGFLCEKITRAIQLDADEILLNINNFFQGMLIRTLGIEQIKQQILIKPSLRYRRLEKLHKPRNIQFSLWSNDKSSSKLSNARCESEL